MRLAGLHFVALLHWCTCSVSKLQFMPAVDNRGYPIKGSCDLEDVGLVSVFDSLASPQPGTALLCRPHFSLIDFI